MGRPDVAVRVATSIVCILYGIALYWAGIRIDADVRRILAYLPAVGTIGILLWDIQLWRWPLVHRLSGRPRLDGLWRVTLQPTAESHIPTGGNRGPIIAYMAIRQSYWRFSARLMTAESASITRSYSWLADTAGNPETISFIYDNSPRQNVQNRSTRHLGTCTLRPGSLEPKVMEGMYFTDRYTQGDMQLKLVGRDGSVASFSEAKQKSAELKRSTSRTKAPRRND